MSQTPLQYHDAVFRMVGETPRVTAAALAAIEEWERREGLRLPPALREWFCIENAVEVLKRFSNCDHPSPLGPRYWICRVRFLEPRYVPDPPTLAAIPAARFDELRSELQILEVRSEPGYVKLMVENQAVCSWFAALSQEHDPTVFCDEDEPYDIEQWSDSGKLSAFLFDWMCSFRFPDWGVHETPTVCSDCLLPDESELKILRESLAEGPATPNNRHGWWYRFFAPDGCVLIGLIRAEDTGLSAPRWEVRAESGEALERLLRVVWPLADFDDGARPQRLKDPVAEDVLQGLGWVRNEGDAAYHLREGSLLRLRDIEERNPALLHQAIEHFSRAIELDRGLKDAYEERLFSLERLGEKERTLADRSRLIELDPRFHVFHLLARCDLYLELGRQTLACEDVCAAIRLEPDHANYADKARKFSDHGRADLERRIFECWRDTRPATSSCGR